MPRNEKQGGRKKKAIHGEGSGGLGSHKQVVIPENSDIPPRSELVQQFTSQLARWHEILLVQHGDMSNGDMMLYQHEGGYAVQQKHQVLDADTPTIWIVGGDAITTRDGYWGSEKILRDMNVNPENYLNKEFRIEIRGNKETGFIDPYNNRPLTLLAIGILDATHDMWPNSYLLGIGVSYADKTENRNQVATYYEQSETSEVTPFYYGWAGFLDHPILLSGDVDRHAKALMDYVDFLITGSASTMLQIEHRDSQKTQTPKTLPPGRRRKLER